MKRYITALGWALCLLLALSICYFNFWGQAFAEGEEWAKHWDTAGVYGPSEGLQIVAGKAAVSAAEVELRNMVINGDLLLQSGIGDGSVTLRNVTVTGEVTVLGGGSLTVIDGQINRILVNNPERAVTLAAEGSAAVWSIRVQSACQIEEKTGDEAVGFGHVYSTTTETLTLAGNFPTLTVENMGGAVNFLSGRIGKVYMESGANDSVLTLGPETEIDVIDLVSAVRIKGTGTINKAVVLADGCELDTDAKAYEFAEGKSVLVAGGIVDADGKRVVTLQPLTDVTLEPGKSTTKTIAVDPADAQVTVASGNTAVATATLSGNTITIKSLAPGKATITVTAVKEGFSTAKETFTVTVNTPELPKVTLQGIKGFTLERGKSATRKVSANPADAAIQVTSSNTSVATAGLSGSTITITAKAAGTATITVTASKAGHTSARITFKVTVPAPQTPPSTPKVGVKDVQIVQNSPLMGSTGIRIYLSNTNNPAEYTVTLNGQPTKYNSAGYFEHAEDASSPNLSQKTKAQLIALVKIQKK